MLVNLIVLYSLLHQRISIYLHRPGPKYDFLQIGKFNCFPLERDCVHDIVKHAIEVNGDRVDIYLGSVLANWEKREA